MNNTLELPLPGIDGLLLLTVLAGKEGTPGGAATGVEFCWISPSIALLGQHWKNLRKIALPTWVQAGMQRP